MQVRQQIVPVSYEQPKLLSPVTQQFVKPQTQYAVYPPQNVASQQQRVPSYGQLAQPLAQQVNQQQRQRFIQQTSPTNQPWQKVVSPDQTVILQRDSNQVAEGPKQPWMGDDVYMVTFLMSVELNRLREENEQLWNERDLVENRARALNIVEGELMVAREKMGEYEKVHALMQSELEMWKSKHEAREKESDDNRYQQDFQRRLLIDHEIRELTTKFINDRNYLETENRKLRQELDELRLKHASVDDIIQSGQQIQNENTRLRQELENFRQGFDQLEYAFKTASELEQQNEQLKNEVNELRSQLHRAPSQTDFNRIEDQNTQLRKELNDLKTQLFKAHNQTDIIKNLEKENIELQQKVNSLNEILKAPGSVKNEVFRKELIALEAENKKLREMLGQKK